MKYYINLLFVICVLMFSCKKEKKVDNTSNSNTSTTGGTTTTLPNGTGPVTCDAIFEIVKGNIKSSGSFHPSSSNQSRAYLCAQPIINDISNTLMDMGEISLNGKIFKSSSFSLNYYYNDTTYTQHGAPYIWNISGSTNIQTQVDTCTTAYPTFTGTSYLPDSLSKSQGITIPINNLGNCDFFKISLIGPSGSQYLAPKLYPGNSTSISFVPNELMGMTTGTGGVLFITFYKDNVKNLTGKNLNFRLGTSYSIYSFKIKA